MGKLLPIIIALSLVSQVAIANDIMGRHKIENGWESSEISVTPKSRYIFTDQYRASVQSEINITYLLIDGTILKVRVEQFPEAKKWSKAQITFATPPNAISMKISHIIRANGHIVAKNFTLAKE